MLTCRWDPLGPCCSPTEVPPRADARTCQEPCASCLGRPPADSCGREQGAGRVGGQRGRAQGARVPVRGRQGGAAQVAPKGHRATTEVGGGLHGSRSRPGQAQARPARLLLPCPGCHSRFLVTFCPTRLSLVDPPTSLPFAGLPANNSAARAAVGWISRAPPTQPSEKEKILQLVRLGAKRPFRFPLPLLSFGPSLDERTQGANKPSCAADVLLLAPPDQPPRSPYHR